MIKLRRLQMEDAENMLEWMHDPENQKGFRRDMMSMTLEDARNFCLEVSSETYSKRNTDLHLAITDETDEYLGTISLKNINMEHRSAEMAISVRRKARGLGVAKKAVGLLLQKSFGEMALHRVYLTVLSNNIVAIKFYEKCGFIYEGELRDHLFIKGNYISWKLYGMIEDEYSESIFSEMTQGNKKGGEGMGLYEKYNGK